jgi:hypothetical protein
MPVVGRSASDEKVRVVAGVEGPRRVTNDRIVTSREGGAVGTQLRIEYDDEQRRYLCTRFEVFRDPDASEGRGFVTTELLRDTPVGSFVAATLNSAIPETGGHIFRELPNPDNVEPWGWTIPDGLREEGPTDRVLQWVAHLYRFAMAVSLNPAQQVEIALDLSHSTASRWVRLARQKGYLGPSEGPGKAAG